MAGIGSFADIAEVEEAHTVAGDTCLLLKVRCADTESLEGLLARLSEFGPVKGTRSYIVLSSYIERGPRP